MPAVATPSTDTCYDSYAGILGLAYQGQGSRAVPHYSGVGPAPTTNGTSTQLIDQLVAQLGMRNLFALEFCPLYPWAASAAPPRRLDARQSDATWARKPHALRSAWAISCSGAMLADARGVTNGNNDDGSQALKFWATVEKFTSTSSYRYAVSAADIDRSPSRTSSTVSMSLTVCAIMPQHAVTLRRLRTRNGSTTVTSLSSSRAPDVCT